MKKEIKNLNTWSLAKIVGTLYGVFGFVFGVLLTLISFAVPDQRMNFFEQLFFGAGAIIFLPLLYGIGGYLSGALLAFVYNFITKKTGGLIVELENIEEETSE